MYTLLYAVLKLLLGWKCILGTEISNLQNYKAVHPIDFCEACSKVRRHRTVAKAFLVIDSIGDQRYSVSTYCVIFISAVTSIL